MHAARPAPRRPAAGRTPGRSGRGPGAAARGRAGAAPRRLCWSPPRSCHVAPTRPRRPPHAAVTERDGRGEPSPVVALRSAAVEPLQADDPTLVGRFRVVGRLGVGGMGRVYAATGPDGRRAAVKVIRDDLADDTGFRHRFRREVAAASAVVGLFTARVLDADPDGEPPWLATEFVEGPSLRDAVLAHGPMPEHALARPGPRARRGAGRDPRGRAGPPRPEARQRAPLPGGPRVIDFGIARRSTRRGSPHRPDHRHPDFMAPEQIEGMREAAPRATASRWARRWPGPRRRADPFATDQTAATLYRIMAMPPDLRGVPAADRGDRRGLPREGPGARPTAVQLAVRLGAGRECPPGARRRDGHAAAGPTAGGPPDPHRRRAVAGAGCGAGCSPPSWWQAW